MAWSLVEAFQDHSLFGPGDVAQTTVTLTSAVAVGDVIALGATLAADPSTLTGTASDSLGNTYTRLSSAQGGQLFDATADQGLDVFFCIVTHAGTPTITYKPDNGTTSHSWLAIKGSHLSGSDASSTRRASAGQKQATPGTGANAISSGSVAASSLDLLWAISMAVDSSTTSIAAGTGFSGNAIDSTTTMIDEWESAAGAAPGTFTDGTNGGAKTYFTVAVAITPASGGGGGTSPMFRGSRG